MKPSKAKAKRRQAQAKARRAAWAARQRDKKNPIRIYPLPLDDETVGTLQDLNWFTDDESRDRKKVGQAIADGLRKDIRGKI